MEKKIGIFAEELLQIVFQKFCKMYTGKLITFSTKVSTIIADDSDEHRARLGYMGYINATLFQLNGKTFAISLGKAWGDYPAYPYKSDILALEILSPETKSDEDISDAIQKCIHLGDFFRHSLIIARRNGQITVAKNTQNRYRKKILESLQPISSNFIAQKLEVDTNSISAIDLEHPTISAVRYKPEFADELVKQLSIILSK